MSGFPTLRALALGLGLIAAGPAFAAGEEVELPNTRFSFEGLFGHFDRASAQRGFQVYKEVCASCHSMHLMSYRNLRQIGLSEAEVAAIAATVQVTDGPNDDGQMIERPGRASDRFKSPFANEQAARAANNNAYPPDLSVITKAREGGADYIHALLLGYGDPPAGVQVAEGLHYNKYFAGHQIAMPQPLSEGQVEYHDGTKATLEQMATDVTQFLTWAAEPEMEERKALGVKMIIFLTILGGLAYAVKRKVWHDVH
ncbi:cytochrome c1 [Belnapia sp. T6]|uniref:Cytochrome c1 n=1 Tax=Belnapia mucosa TaxID=2804532 RepID=A0ABS1UXF0_9PROT|nr:cytochrome c1 [Belnapia mucosa]MBL6454002.1 cytochrome c1 [Belnapia mucosa]